MRTIPIAPQRPSAPALSRREFLGGTGVLFGSLATGSLLAALAPSTAWALELHALTQPEGAALLAMGRTLYPHDKLPDAVYALLVKDLDAKADSLATLREGVAALDKAADGSFVEASPARRLEIVKAIEGNPFFSLVRGQCVTSLYDNEMAFAVFGYEGASFDKGGYLLRGFQDLTWLPAPPESASPAPDLG
ncbi:MAG: twin-arginine translocation signal domain-containing protein [Burkholderiales bacterium]|nr:twin-arginine translocation signal domain-containing protein [Burkholderiales bacterium]MDE2396393.1 twin-arginine translocation signal domain-containing protein [Burkholderiales bacterium]MDE2456421.1 twin-arginine translocation signal domain-containing protein [Burkholderiales bacterium]